MRGFVLELEGDFACFSRPEMKVERVSYDVITPSAARNIFCAIFWKPAIEWRIKKIEVLKPVRWASIRRNEVSQVASPRSKGIFVEEDRQQRAGLILRDVRYRVSAEFIFIPEGKRPKVSNPVPEFLLDQEEAVAAGRNDENEAKYAAIFDRRATKGQCFIQPYLGCREFSCRFRLVKPGEELAPPIAESRDLGWMLYDMDYSDPKDIKPMFFRAEMKNGVIDVPAPDGEEVRK